MNRAIAPMTDQAHWGTPDRWDFAEDGLGDCEDYALVKRRQLVALGLPRTALLMTVVLDETGDGHMVLTVRTTTGDFILDNRTSAILRWDETGLEFVKREHPLVPTRWDALVRARGTT